METTTLYRKIGKRYIKQDDYLNEKGLPCGLYLFYKPSYKGEHLAMMNMIHYAKVHDIKDISSFCDIFVKYESKILEKLQIEIDIFKNSYTVSDLAMIMLKIMSELK